MQMLYRRRINLTKFWSKSLNKNTLNNWKLEVFVYWELQFQLLFPPAYLAVRREKELTCLTIMWNILFIKLVLFLYADIGRIPNWTFFGRTMKETAVLILGVVPFSLIYWIDFHLSETSNLILTFIRLINLK